MEKQLREYGIVIDLKAEKRGVRSSGDGREKGYTNVGRACIIGISGKAREK